MEGVSAVVDKVKDLTIGQAAPADTDKVQAKPKGEKKEKPKKADKKGADAGPAVPLEVTFTQHHLLLIIK